MFIYNISLFVLFFTLFQFVNFETKTLFSFSDLGSSNLLTKILTLTILSMAGVPPFWGFFTKILKDPDFSRVHRIFKRDIYYRYFSKERSGT